MAMTRPAPGLAAHHPWWQGAVIYQIYPRSFGDANGDGIGDLPGITARLEHVASLGVDAVWLSPFFASPMKDFGYDVSDYLAVDPIFGTLEDFDALLARAHDLGLRVIIDQVYAHTSDRHAWFVESRANRANAKADWYVWADPKPDGSPPNNWQSVFGGPAWTWDARREQYYLHNFLKEQPQLNGHEPDVQAALLDVARFWLDRGVDGFRIDAINFAQHDPALTDNPPVRDPKQTTRPFDFQHHVHNQSQPGIPAFLDRVSALVRGYDGERFTVAEVGGELAPVEMKLYTHQPERLYSAYSFEFLYAPALLPEIVLETFADWPGAPGEGWPSWAFSNHDAPRAVTRWAAEGDRAAMARLSLMLLMCLRGNVFLYYGEELGLPQAHVPFERLVDPEAIENWPQTLGRDGARTPMPWSAQAAHAGFSTVEPWLPVDPRHVPLAVDVQEADPASVLHFSRAMVALRQNSPALRGPAATPLALPAPLLGFERGDGDGRLLCLFNPGTAAAAHGVDLAGWREVARTGDGDGARLGGHAGRVYERVR